MTNRPVCVLLPGMLCTAELWRAQRTPLTALADVRVVELTAGSIDQMVDQVLSLPDHRLALAGMSLGGIVAMSVALAAPDRVSSLALLSTSARAPRPDQYDGWKSMIARTRAGDFHRITPQDLVPLMVHPERLTDPTVVSTVVAMADRVGPHVFLDQLAAQQSRVDLRAMLPAIRCPTLVVGGADDRLAPPAVHQEIADLIPGATLTVLPCTAHLSPLERPDEVTELLRDWLLGASATSAVSS